MVYEIDATVQRGTYIKKEVKNVPRHFSKATTSQYKKFTPFENKTKTGYVLAKCPLLAHRFRRVEYRIFVIVFFRQAQVKKSKQIFDIRHFQIDELPKKIRFSIFC